MHNYWVTFRIEDNPTYQTRYDAFIETVSSYKLGFWSEPTSFMLVEANIEIDAFVREISKPLDRSKDLLLVRYISRDASRVFGKSENFDVLQSFFPNIKKL